MAPVAGRAAAARKRRTARLSTRNQQANSAGGIHSPLSAYLCVAAAAPEVPSTA